MTRPIIFDLAVPVSTEWCCPPTHQQEVLGAATAVADCSHAMVLTLLLYVAVVFSMHRYNHNVHIHSDVGIRLSGFARH